MKFTGKESTRSGLARPWHIQIRQLHYFVVVAEEGNLNRAAERLHMSKPPLGRQIRYMEAILGVQLFDRTQSGMVLTTAGRKLLAHAYRILESCWRAEQQTAKSGEAAAQFIALGFSDDFLFSALGGAITAFRKDNPEVMISANLAYGHDIVDSLSLGKLQVGLVNAPLPANITGLSSRPLPSLPIFVAMAPDHPLADKDTVSLVDLQDNTFIVGNILPHNAFYLRVLALLQRAEFSPTFLKNIWPKEFQLDLVGQGIGVTLLTCSDNRPPRSDVAFVQLSDSDATIDRCIVWVEEDKQPAHILTLVDYVEAAFS